MTDRNRQPEPTPDLARDLKCLYRTPGAVPRHVDRAILEQARARLAVHRRLPVWRIAAAAAAVMLLAVAWWTLVPYQAPAMAADVDRSGTVNILDALQLARRVEGAADLRPDWDINRDGVVDRADADAVAMLAVRLDRKEVL